MTFVVGFFKQKLVGKYTRETYRFTTHDKTHCATKNIGQYEIVHVRHDVTVAWR